MLESHNNSINSLLEKYIKRLEEEIAFTPPELLTNICECIVGLYLLKQSINQKDAKGSIELRLMRNLDNIIKDNNDPREI